MKPILGILLGEAAGIGPELVAKMCGHDLLKPYCRPILIGDKRILEKAKKITMLEFAISSVTDTTEVDWDDPSYPMLDLHNLDPEAVTFGTIDANSGRITGDMLVYTLELLKQGKLAGFVFAPLNKAAMKAGGYHFSDEHRLFAHYLNWAGSYGEMNILNDLWTSRVTSHIPLNEVCSRINKENITEAVKLAHDTLTKAGFKLPKIVVAAVNPHGGENGTCGKEELEIIMPAVQECNNMGINVTGPFPADTIFIKAFKGEYDAVVTMFHDQGQIALKLMGFQAGVTVSAGLPYAITTPAHGTAFDIAGKGIANTGAMEQAVILAAKMAAFPQSRN